MAKFLFTSDVHLSAKPSEAYRWQIFPWLTTQAINRKVDAIFILGDLTDAKNHHDNAFVNQIIDELQRLTTAGQSVYIIKGNHDYSDPNSPLLRFLKHEPVTFFTRPSWLEVAGSTFMMIPHTRDKNELHEALQMVESRRPQFVLMHQTFEGAMAANGFPLPGIGTDKFPRGPIYIAGDIHVPQKIGPVTYCGAPHHTAFGETFDPRVLFWNEDKMISIKRAAVRKRLLAVKSIHELTPEAADEGDHVKIRIALAEEELHTWSDIRRRASAIAAENNWILCGLELEPVARVAFRGPAPKRTDPADVLSAYCTSHDVSSSRQTLGKTLLKKASDE